MAKHCSVCNLDYVDELAACPHCAAAKKTQLAGRIGERTTQLATHDDERATQLDEVHEEPAEIEEIEEIPDSAVNLGRTTEEFIEVDSDRDLAQAETGEPSQHSAEDSNIAAEALLSEPSGEGMASEEERVSEAEVDELLSNLEEEPVGSALSGVTPEEAADIAEGEEAIAAAEAEEAAEAQEAAETPEAEDEKPAKTVRPRPNIPVLAGTMALGILLGVGGTIGVRSLTGSSEKENRSVALNVPSPPQAPVHTFESRAARVASGDWDEAQAAGIEELKGTNTKELVALGEYRLGRYLKKVGSKINPDDPDLQPAILDLQKAAEQNDPDALYDLAFIKELAGKLREARADYEKAAQSLANNPAQKQRFDSAILRVDLKAASKAAAGAALAPRNTGAAERTVLLALLLVGLQEQPEQQPQQPAQAPQQPAQPAPGESKEAGHEFWHATKLAHDGKFSEAIQAIDQAHKLHEQQRFTRMRKAQNPHSDPGEDIFLRCCDELKTYWQLESQLREGGYLTDKNTPADALQALVQKAKSPANETMVKDLKDKLAAAQQSQKEADAKLAEQEKKLQAVNDINAQLDRDLKSAKKSAEERQAELIATKKQIEKIQGDYDTHNVALKRIREDLVAANFLENNDKANLGDAVKKAIEVARSKDPQSVMRRQVDEIARLTMELQERLQPEQMLPLWMMLLDENRLKTDLPGLAMKDAQRVLADPRAIPARKGEAEVVLGLALRNAAKFRDAKARLEAGREAVKGEWRLRADDALKEVSNPTAYFISQARMLSAHGEADAARALLERALKVLPMEESGKLLAERGLIELDAARTEAKGKQLEEPLLTAARRDAVEAIKAGAPAGHYAAGRIAEETGQVDAAIASYRAALAAYGDKVDAESGRYRMALARVLLQPREARSVQPPPAPDGQKVGRRDPASYPPKHFEEMKSLALMLTFGLQAPLSPGDQPGQEEAEKLADDVLRAPPDTVPFNVRAQALAVKGRWSDALRLYVEGIQPMLPREYGIGLMQLIRNDPRLSRPEGPRVANPMEADKHFAAGLNFYFDRDYANAEKSFLLTVENDSQDARFFYFLGLSRLAQNRRRDAYADFAQGVQLERLNRPASAAVDYSLERIQGAPRSILNEFRENPVR